MGNPMKNFLKKITGIERLEKERQTALEAAALAVATAKEAEEAKRIAKLSPKELATERKESYVAVLDTKVNKDNPRNGFFELDWNEFFIVELKAAGYNGETEEAIVDQWFQDLCRNIGNEQNVNMDRRGSGYINVNSLGDGRSEIS
jgi:hypothetical protein